MRARDTGTSPHSLMPMDGGRNPSAKYLILGWDGLRNRRVNMVSEELGSTKSRGVK